MTAGAITASTSASPARIAGAAGVAAIALACVGAVIAPMWDLPGTLATAAEIESFVVAERTQLLTAMTLYSIAVPLWLVFGAGVWLGMREALGGESLLSACFALGLVGFVTLLLAGFVPLFVLAYRAEDVADPWLLYDLSFGLLAMSGPLTAIALGSFALAVLRARHLPAWTAYLAVVAAVAHLLLIASFRVSEGFFSLEGQVITVIPGTLFVWIAGTGIAMLARR
ncbi:MAG TPA: hypothetical protein VEQ61_00455 [Thermoleophilaceae bacterium]|nr:hypothetical protein [Thermoleophilaceae bacterium]